MPRRCARAAEDVEIVARLADRRDGLRHRHDELVAARAADVVAFKRGGRRQHDIGEAARSRSTMAHAPRSVSGLRPGAAQLVGVLVMVERIAASPIDQLDVGIGAALAVIVVALARMQQAIGDARRRDGDVDRILHTVHRRSGISERRIADAGAGAITEAEAATGQADLAERRSEQHHRPIRLLAVVARCSDQDAVIIVRVAAMRRASARMVSAGTSVIDAAQSASFGSPSVVAHEIGQNAIEAGAILLEEVLIVQPFADQRVRHGEQHRGVGVRPDRNPLRAVLLGSVVAQRADIDDLDAGTRQVPPSSRGSECDAAAALASPSCSSGWRRRTAPPAWRDAQSTTTR